MKNQEALLKKQNLAEISHRCNGAKVGVQVENNMGEKTGTIKPKTKQRENVKRVSKNRIRTT